MDGCVLLVGCDKTTPSLLMAAASTDLPSIIVTGGPMLNGYYKNERVGSGTHLWKFSEAVKAGTMTKEEFVEAEASMSRSPGSCNTMGTASTMASMAEALGMALSGNAAIPAVDSRRRVMAQLTGRRIVQMVKDDLKPSDILKKEAFENAIRTNAAIGGSTNAVIHLLAIAGRAVVFEDIDDYKAKINDEALDIDETCVMVLKNCGPKGYPGMAEVGNMGLPPKVLRKGITDMVRISDARMSGTAFGTVVLHTSPEAAAGGPLAVVQNGDMITLDVPNRSLHLEVSDAELAARLAKWQSRIVPPPSGYALLHHLHVQGADTGADLDFLNGGRGNPVGKDSH